MKNKTILVIIPVVIIIVVALVLYFNNKGTIVIDLTGKTESEVVDWCEENEVDCDHTYINSDDVEKGKVIKQSINPKTKIQKDQTLEIWFSLGPDDESEKEDYVNGSKTEILISSIDTFIQAATTSVNDNAYGPISNGENVYFIPVSNISSKSCVDLEKGGTDPFGEWKEAYVVVHYNPNMYSFDYYFTFYDDAGYGMALTKSDDIRTDGSDIQENTSINSSNITKNTTIKTSSGNLANVVVLSKANNCQAN